MDFFINCFNVILDMWKVGCYEVVLMDGELMFEYEIIFKVLEFDYVWI